MNSSSLKDIKEIRFWSALKVVETIDTPIKITTLQDSFNISEEALLDVKERLSQFQICLIIKESWVFPILDKPKTEFNLSLSEWVATQMHLRDLDFNFGVDITKKDDDFSNDPVVREIQKYINQKSMITMTDFNGQRANIYPFQICFLENNLQLVYEDSADGVLKTIPVFDIEEINKSETNYHKNFSQSDATEFLNEAKSLNGSVVRIVIKIKNDQSVDLVPPFQNVISPYVATNFLGEKIWAGTLELNDGLFEWIFAQDENFEIIDPQIAKNEFKKFCENRLKSVA